jgi:hypothetical protein
MDEATIRNQAFFYANETHPNKFSIDDKPTLEDLLERAEKIAKFIEEGVRD